MLFKQQNNISHDSLNNEFLSNSPDNLITIITEAYGEKRGVGRRITGRSPEVKRAIKFLEELKRMSISDITQDYKHFLTLITILFTGFLRSFRGGYLEIYGLINSPRNMLQSGLCSVSPSIFNIPPLNDDQTLQENINANGSATAYALQKVLESNEKLGRKLLTMKMSYFNEIIREFLPVRLLPRMSRANYLRQSSFIEKTFQWVNESNNPDKWLVFLISYKSVIYERYVFSAQHTLGSTEPLVELSNPVIKSLSDYAEKMDDHFSKAVGYQEIESLAILWRKEKENVGVFPCLVGQSDMEDQYEIPYYGDVCVVS